MKKFTRLLFLIAWLVMSSLMSVTTAFGQWTIDEGFEGGAIPSDWTVYDDNGDGEEWMAYQNTDYAHTGDWMATAGDNNYSNDDHEWLVTPPVTIQSGDSFTFWARSWYSTEDFTAWISTSNTSVTGFEWDGTKLEEVEGIGSDWIEYTYDLSAYAGQEVYLGIEWIQDTYCLLVDDVKVGQEGGSTLPIEGFETWPPTDWTISSATDDNWVQDDGTDHGPDAAYAGTYAAMYNNYDISSGNSGSMTTPAFDVSALTTPQVSFYWWNDDGSSSPATLEVLSSTDGTTFTSIEIIEVYGSGGWVQYSHSIGTDVTHIKLTAVSDWGSENTFVDEFAIEEAPIEAPTLFFSEYIEGSSYNKALEIYNASDITVDLTEFAFPNVSNDPATPGQYEYWNEFDAGSTLAPGEVFVIAHPDADAAILAEADMVFTYLSNGDDGFALVYGTEASYEVLDWIGTWDGDPGDGWEVAGVADATKDHTLVRKPDITEGNIDWAASAGTNADDSEWIVLDQDTFDYLGSFPNVIEDTWPPANLDYSLIGENNVILEWDTPAPPVDGWLFYHDGTFEGGLASTNGGAGIAQMFQPAAYPCTIDSINFYVSAQGVNGQEIEAWIIADDGATVLGGPYTSVVDTLWNIIDIDDIEIASGGFMIATYNVLASGPYIGYDSDTYNGTLYFGSHTGGFTELGEYGYYGTGSHEAYVVYGSDIAAGHQVLKPIENENRIERSDIAINKTNSTSDIRHSRGLLGYNVYRDGAMINTELVSNTYYADADVAFGSYVYTVTAMYDGGESDPSLPVDVTLEDVADFIPPFFEDFASEDFQTNFWVPDPLIGSKWSVSTSTGNPEPSAMFSWFFSGTNYSQTLTGHAIDCAGLTEIDLSFDLMLNNYSTATLEQMGVEVWDGSAWVQVALFDNADDDFDWIDTTIDITAYAAGIATQVRFVAFGEDAYNINYWFIDNVGVSEHGDLLPPTNLEVDNTGYATWEVPGGSSGDLFELIQHDGNAVNGYYQAFDNGYGVVYDVSGYTDVTVEMLDFRHSSWGITGTWDYTLHIVDWDTYAEIATVSGLQTTVNDNWELEIDLGSVSASGLVGIFLEPQGNLADDAYPCLDSDDIGPDGLSYFGPLADYSGMGLSEIGDFLMDLWIMGTGTDGIVKAKKFNADFGNGNARLSSTTPNVDFITLKQSVTTRDFVGYKVFLDGEYVDETTNLYWQYADLIPEETYMAGVSAVYDEGESEIVEYEFTVTDGYIELGFEPFEDYNAGDYLVQQAIALGYEHWTTWSNAPGTSEDPMVSDAQAYEGANSVVIEGTNDAILLLGDHYTSGVFNAEFYAYIPTGKVGYFNILQLFDGSSSEWGMQAFFDVDGAGLVDAGGAGAGVFTYTYDTWHHVSIDIDLDNDYAEMYFNDAFVVSWVWSSGAFGSGTLNELHAMNLYAWDATGTPGTFFDNLRFSKEAVEGPAIAVNPESFTELHDNPPTITTQTLVITNEGTEALTWDITVDSDVAEYSAPPIDPEAYNRLLERMRSDGLITDVYSDIAPGTFPGAVSYTDDDFDLQFEYACGDATGEAGIETDGNYIYTTKWNGGDGFFKYEMDGTFIGSFAIPGASNVRDLAYDGTYFYGAAANTTVFQMDFDALTLVGTITAPVDVRAIAYDESADGFWGNNWSTTLTLFSRDGNILNTIATAGDESFYGLAYAPLDGTLWGFSQKGGTSLNMLYQYDISSGTIIQEFDMLSILTMPTVGDDMAGGLFIHPDIVSGTWTLGGLVQNVCLWGVEMGTTTQYTNDVGVQSFISPVTGPDLTNGEVVTIKVKNYGTASQSDIPVYYTLDGGAQVTGIVPGPIASGESAEYTFAGTVDLSVPGQSYVFEGCTDLTGDENTDNDCKAATVTNVIPAYCDASTDNEDEWIANVLCGAINNSSGWQGGVADYTDISTTINAGESEAITVTNGNAYSSDLVTVWVDWNDDFEFAIGGDEEFVLTNVGGTGEIFEGIIAAPADAADGDHRMRVRMTYSTAPEPCGSASYGEVEDYTIVSGGGQPPIEWLSVDLTNGTIDPGMSQDVIVSFNSADMSSGVYNGMINIANNDPNNPLVEIPVEFTIEGAGCENFDALTVGGLVAEQLGGMWTTWSGTSADDATVSDVYSNSPFNSFVVDAGAVDLVLKLDDAPITSGKHLYSNYIYVPSGYSGYFNVQSEPTPGVDWVIELFFDDGGTGSFAAGGSTETFSYVQDTWILVEINFDMDNGLAQVLFDGVLMTQWVNEFTIGGIDYYGHDAGGAPGAYYDDVCFGEGWEISCIAPTDLTAVITEFGGYAEVVLNWEFEMVVPTWISYHDGTFENAFASTDGGAGIAQVFTPEQYPCTVTEVQFFVSGYGSFDQNIEVYVLTGDGATILAGPYVVPGVEDNWVLIDVDDVTITEGTFMVATFNELPGGPYIGVDDSFYDGSLYFGSIGAFTELGVWEYYYVGSHEALVEYTTSDNVVVNSVLTSPSSNNSRAELSESKTFSDGTVKPNRDFISFSIYRNDEVIEEGWGETTYMDVLYAGGDYTYYVTAVYDECTSEPSNDTTVACYVSVEELTLEESIEVYPNPAVDYINVISSKGINTITVFDYLGQIIYEMKVVEDNNIKLNTASYGAGVYFIKVYTEEGIAVKRVMITR